MLGLIDVKDSVSAVPIMQGMQGDHRDSPALEFDAAMLCRYGVNGPRYTSYPTAPQFHTGFSVDDYREAATRSNREGRPLSIYVHVPFCRTVCFYCACNKVITANYARAEAYLHRLEREVELQARLFDTGRVVEQLHFGGGTPTYLRMADMQRLLASLGRHFELCRDDTREFSIEIDPRTTEPDDIAVLGALGFNRVSFGVQDFDPRVQRAVNRIQSYDLTANIMGAARDNGFGSINLDLIYGLPQQTPATMVITLDKVLELAPERLAVYNYAHLPEMFKVQRQIDTAALPDSATRLAMLELIIRKLTEAGYLYIGMDHFALPDDELALAYRDGSLQRNFQGYSTHAPLDLIGFGASAIGRVDDCHAQSLKNLDDYSTAIDDARLPLWRGLRLSPDDRLRRDVIMSIMCRSGVEFAAVEREHEIEFKTYFAAELEALQPLVDDGLCGIDSHGICVTPRGRLLLRNIAMPFDAYLGENSARYSRAI